MKSKFWAIVITVVCMIFAAGLTYVWSAPDAKPFEVGITGLFTLVFIYIAAVHIVKLFPPKKRSRDLSHLNYHE